MFKLNKSLRKLGVVSVSALMLLGVGAGISSAHANVHAESLSEAMAQAKYNADKGADEDNSDLYHHFKDNPQYAITVKQDDPEAYNEVANTYNYSIPRSAWTQYHQHLKALQSDSGDSYGAQLRKDNAAVAAMGHGNDSAHAAVHYAQHHANTPKQATRSKQSIKSQLNRVHKARKHAHKHTTRVSLRQQIRSLKRELHQLENKMRIHRAKHSRRYMRLLKQQYRANNNQLHKLNRQLTKSSNKRANHKISKHVTRHHAKRHSHKNY